MESEHFFPVLIQFEKKKNLYAEDTGFSIHAFFENGFSMCKQFSNIGCFSAGFFI